MELKTLNVSDIKVKFNHREIGDVSGMMTSIKTEGLLTPVAVVKENGGYFLVDGHRRLEAHKKLNIKKIDALVDSDAIEDRELLLRQATHNEARKSLSVFERYLLYKKLQDAQYTMEEIASALDVAVRSVQEVSSLGRHLPLEKLKDVTYGKQGAKSNKGKVSLGNARKVAILSKSGKLNGKKLNSVWNVLKKGKKVESINVKNEILTHQITLSVPVKYRDKFENATAMGKAISKFLDMKLFKNYV
jgi:ParB/RepB/Spo0J family partition protein